MSVFICARCDRYGDADDGCKEVDDGRGPALICAECIADDEETPNEHTQGKDCTMADTVETESLPTPKVWDWREQYLICEHVAEDAESAAQHRGTRVCCDPCNALEPSFLDRQDMTEEKRRWLTVGLVPPPPLAELPIGTEPFVEVESLMSAALATLTKCEIYAGFAMLGLCANRHVTEVGLTPREKAESALLHAVALVAVVEKHAGGAA